MPRVTLDDPVYDDGSGRRLSMRDLLAYFIRRGSLRVSDLHLKVGAPPVYRVDGELVPLKSPPLDRPAAESLVASLLSDEQQREMNSRRAVDASVMDEAMQFRLNCFYDSDGPAAAIRALDAIPIDVEKIGFPNRVWSDIVHSAHGLVLVTGITGAGKSTTIASLIRRIAETQTSRIITLEDPVEYRLASAKSLISQREIGRDVPSFERGLRDCLREDPDVIFVGEMRDRESASWTLTAAETGHLVFSTLHTRDVRGSITRILDMFPEGQHDEVANQLSLGLSHIISQKLVPRADGEGRVVAMEIAHNTYAFSNLIRLRKVEQMYTALQTRTKDVPEERMITMERSLALLVHSGVVTRPEAEKWANHPSSLADELAQFDEP